MSNLSMGAIREKIESWRIKKGYNYSELGELTGSSHNTWRRVLKGLSNPSLELVLTLIKKTDITVEYLFTDNPEEQLIQKSRTAIQSEISNLWAFVNALQEEVISNETRISELDQGKKRKAN